MKLRDLILIAGAASTILGLAACAGSNSAAPNASVLPALSADRSASFSPDRGVSGAQVAIEFTKGTSNALKAGTSVVLQWKGHTVGHAVAGASKVTTIALTQRVPAGAVLLAKTPKVSASFFIAKVGKNTAVLVREFANKTIHVTTASGLKPTSTPSTDDPNGCTEDENEDGDASKVEIGTGGTLPAGLPFGASMTCTDLTLTPDAGQTFSSLKFEEQLDGGNAIRANDGGSSANDYKYEGPFDSALDVPVIAGSTVKMELFQNDQRVLEIEAPIGAFGTPTGATPCPSPAPSASPSAEPSASPEPTETP